MLRRGDFEVSLPDAIQLRAVCAENDFAAARILGDERASLIGVQSVTPLRFAPDAEVLICPGEDRRPGHARFDDNGDGVVDDSGELGAIHSDDVSLAPADEGYVLAARDDACRVISRGAFVPDDRGRKAIELERVLISGSLDGQPWERIVCR